MVIYSEKGYATFSFTVSSIAERCSSLGFAEELFPDLDNGAGNRKPPRKGRKKIVTAGSILFHLLGTLSDLKTLLFLRTFMFLIDENCDNLITFASVQFLCCYSCFDAYYQHHCFHP